MPICAIDDDGVPRRMSDGRPIPCHGFLGFFAGLFVRGRQSFGSSATKFAREFSIHHAAARAGIVPLVWEEGFFLLPIFYYVKVTNPNSH
jgi:hypothetical protein